MVKPISGNSHKPTSSLQAQATVTADNKKWVKIVVKNAQPDGAKGARNLPDLAGSIAFISDKQWAHGMTHKLIGGVQKMVGYEDKHANMMHAMVILNRVRDSDGNLTNQVRVAEAIEQGIIFNTLDLDAIRGGDETVIYRPKDPMLRGSLMEISFRQAADFDEKTEQVVEVVKKVSKYALTDLAVTPLRREAREAYNKERLSYALADAIMERQVHNKSDDKALAMICSSFGLTSYQLAAALPVADKLIDQLANAWFPDQDAATVRRDMRDEANEPRAMLQEQFLEQLNQEGSPLHELYHNDDLMSLSGRFVMPARLAQVLDSVSVAAQSIQQRI